MFNWSYNLNRDLFWSRSLGNNNSNNDNTATTQSVPCTPGPGPTVALPPGLYRERRGLAARALWKKTRGYSDKHCEIFV